MTMGNFYTSDDVNVKRRRRGCYVTYPWIVVWVLTTVAAAIGVGVAAYYLLRMTQSSGHDVTAEDSCHGIGKLTGKGPCANKDAEGSSNYRIPPGVHPTHYNIELQPDIYQVSTDLFTVNGTVEIFLTCEVATDALYIHSKGLKVAPYDVILRNSTGTNIRVLEQIYDDQMQWFRFRLERQLTPEEKVVLGIRFKGPLGTKRGIFWSQYKDYNITKYMVATQFEPSDARAAFPCMDEPAFKATFNVTLWRKEPMVALSNMPLESSKDMGQGWLADRFATTSVNMSTYLNAFAIADYNFIDDTSDGGLKDTYMRYWAPHQSIGSNQLEFARSICAKILSLFEIHFNMSYALPKLDMISVPDFRSGAMENWGLVTYKPTRLLWDPRHMSPSQQQSMAGTMAHEVLHMWIGNVVTCAWWDDIWLNEGFARFYQYYALAQVMPEWDMDQRFITHVSQPALDGDSSGSATPIFSQVQAPAEAGLMFNMFTYEKAACVIKMLQEALGHQAFYDAIQKYIHKHAYQNVRHGDLYTIFSQVANNEGVSFGVTPGEFLDTWIKQQGYPVVTFSRQPDGTTVMVTQRMFLKNPLEPVLETEPSPYGTKVRPQYSETCLERPHVRAVALDRWSLFTESITLSSPLAENDWILGNVRALGFYRVNYDSSNWAALIDQMKTDYTAIHVINRAVLIDDAMALARACDLSQLSALHLIDYLPSEVEYLPLQTLRRHIRYLDQMLQRFPQYTNFRAKMRNVFRRNYDLLGWDGNNDENIHTTYLRKISITEGCRFGLSGCQQEAQRRFQQWRNSPQDRTIIRPDIRYAVYCHGVQQGTDDDWEFLWRRLLVEDDKTEKKNLVYALACSTKLYLLNRYLLLASTYLNGTILPGDTMVYAIVRNPAGRQLVWEYLNEHKADKDRILWSFAVSAATQYFATDHELDQVRSYFCIESDEDGKTNLEYSRVNVAIRANKLWLERNKADILPWLQEV